MNNLTTAKKKMQVSEALKLLTDIVGDLEASGVKILHAQASDEPYILLAHEKSEFFVWAKQTGLSLNVEPSRTENDYGLHWRVTVMIDGVDIHGYLTDAEKEELDEAV